jgi:FtsP/CotA-like multicopper oxidase with cupredoxin domain
MKFRLATSDDLKEHNIKPPTVSHTCQDEPCSEYDYKFYEEKGPGSDAGLEAVRWHDTMPVPITGPGVFLIMSFDAAEQVGRFVYHCHILKHEDRGLMAPIEVWDPSAPTVER